MGAPRFGWRDIPLARAVDTKSFALDVPGFDLPALKSACAVSVGNPHCVLFVDDAEAAPVETLGPAIERHAMFPERTNVEFVSVLAPNRLRMRVWERGVGITRACGTGAAAAVARRMCAGWWAMPPKSCWTAARCNFPGTARQPVHDRAGGAELRGRSRSGGAGARAMTQIVTFGCRLNAYESEAIRARAGEAGLEDAVIFNTCAVTAEAVRQSRQAIRKARRENPEAKHHRHRLRRADRTRNLCRNGGSRSGARQ